MDRFLKAVELIKNGEIVAFPTETVYGLGADAFNESACLKIYKTKGRPSNNPLIVHVATTWQAQEIAEFNKHAEALSVLWPGPLTLVLPKRTNSRLANCVTAGLNSVAIRVPAHELALNLIKASNCPLAAPSANKSGNLSATMHKHVVNEFNSQVFTLEAESSCQYGLESTIVDLTTKIPVILRFGFITPDVVESLLGIKPQIANKLSAIKAPGMLLKHYAPKTKLRLNVHSLNQGEIGLNFGDSKLNNLIKLNLSPSGDLAEAARNIFNFLHQLDDFALLRNISTIAVAPIPNSGIGLAINDRLLRAAY